MQRVIAGISAVIVSAGLALYLPNGSSDQRSNLDMSIESGRSGLRLGWNCREPVSGARKVLLRIADRGASRLVELTADQLPKGSLLYVPSSDDVLFDMRVFVDGEVRATKEVRFVGEVAPRAIVETPVVPAAASPAVRPTHRRLPPVELEPDFADRDAPPPVRPVLNEAAGEIPPKEVTGTITSALPLVLPQPVPAVAKPEQSTAPAPPELALPLERPRREAAFPRSTDPSAPAWIQPPRPLHRVLPEARPAGAPLTFQSSAVAIGVRIDERGHVVEARLVSASPNTSQFLIGAALNAARQWGFEPSKVHGQAVASDFLINFTFRPNSR